MRAMLLRSPRTALASSTLPDPRPGRGAGPRARSRVRRMPHRSRTSSTASCRMRDRRSSRVMRSSARGSGDRVAGVDGLADRRSRRHPVARLHLRRVPYCRVRPRESVRCGALHRLHDRRRLRRASGRRRALLLRAAGRIRRMSTLAPWLCAGLIGYRALAHGRRREAHRASTDLARRRTSWRSSRATKDARSSRSRDPAMSRLRRSRATWARRGRAAATKPAPYRSTRQSSSPRWAALVPKALRDVGKGGTVVCAGIHMSDIPSFPYAILWGERRVVSVANLTRRDGVEFFAAAGEAGIRTHVAPYPLRRPTTRSGVASGRLTGAAVLMP